MAKYIPVDIRIERYYELYFILIIKGSNMNIFTQFIIKVDNHPDKIYLFECTFNGSIYKYFKNTLLNSVKSLDSNK